MSEPNDEHGLAMLDEQQDRQRGKRRRLRPELLIGVGLMVVIAAWSGWNYIHDQNGRSNYIAGQNAEVAKDWDSAQRYFVAAGDYADAPVHAHNAGVNISHRNNAYQDAQSAINQQNWLHAYNALGKVRDIQPAYRDSATLYTQARDAVYTGALSGTVAMLDAANRPGLYEYTATGWLWLPGTNLKSELRASSGCQEPVLAAVIADATGASGAATPTSSATQRPKPTVTAVTSAGQVAVTTLDPRVSDDATVICAGHGLLILNQDVAASNVPSDWRTQVGFANNKFSYQEYGNTRAHDVVLPDNSAAVGFAFAQDQIVVAQVSGDKQADGAILNPVSHYFLMSLRDNSMKEIASASNLPYYVIIEPDSGFLIVNDRIPIEGTKEQQSLKIIDITGQTAEIDLVSWVVDRSSYVMGYFASVLPGGPLKGKIVLTRFGTEDNNQIQLIDPASPDQALWSSGTTEASSFATHPLDDKLLLTSTGPYCRSDPRPPTILDSSYQTKTLQINQAPGQYLSQIVQRKDRLVYVTTSLCASGSSDPYNINSMPVAALETGRGPSLNLYTAPADNNLPKNGTNWSLGASLLAYIKDDGLHVVNYDGSDDTLLEPGVSVLYQLQASN